MHLYNLHTKPFLNKDMARKRAQRQNKRENKEREKTEREVYALEWNPGFKQIFAGH